VEALRASDRFYTSVIADELREENVSSLISCGAMARRSRQYALALKYIVKGILISPWLVMRELHRRKFFSRLFRKIGRMLLNASRVWGYQRHKT
jgi:uncharacterized membrane protein YbaN (DUF454 family)